MKNIKKDSGNGFIRFTVEQNLIRAAQQQLASDGNPYPSSGSKFSKMFKTNEAEIKRKSLRGAIEKIIEAIRPLSGNDAFLYKITYGSEQDWTASGLVEVEDHYLLQAPRSYDGVDKKNSTDSLTTALLESLRYVKGSGTFRDLLDQWHTQGFCLRACPDFDVAPSSLTGGFISALVKAGLGINENDLLALYQPLLGNLTMKDLIRLKDDPGNHRLILLLCIDCGVRDLSCIDAYSNLTGKLLR